MHARRQGGRAHLSKLFARHVRNTISKHRAVAQRGGDPDQMRDIQVWGAGWGVVGGDGCCRVWFVDVMRYGLVWSGLVITKQGRDSQVGTASTTQPPLSRDHGVPSSSISTPPPPPTLKPHPRHTSL